METTGSALPGPSVATCPAGRQKHSAAALEHRRALLGAAFSTAIVLASGALADGAGNGERVDPASTVEIVLNVDGIEAHVRPDENGHHIRADDGTVSYSGSYHGARGSTVSWKMSCGVPENRVATSGSSAPAAVVATISASFLLDNSASTVAQAFSVSVVLPAGPGVAPALMGGNTAGFVLDLDGSGCMISTPPAGEISSFLVDGAVVATLLQDPYSVAAPPWAVGLIGPAAFGQPIPSQPVVPPLASIGYTATADLSAADLAIVSAVFVVTW